MVCMILCTGAGKMPRAELDLRGAEVVSVCVCVCVCGVVWCGVDTLPVVLVWCGVVWCGVVWCGVDTLPVVLVFGVGVRGCICTGANNNYVMLLIQETPPIFSPFLCGLFTRQSHKYPCQPVTVVKYSFLH